MKEVSSSSVLWLFGLPSAGKTTLGRALVQHFQLQAQRTVVLLDGDQLRHGVCTGLGFSDEDRAENLRRAAEIAKLLSSQGLRVVCAFITPKEEHRRLVKTILGNSVTLIHVECPLEVCAQRDVKGLYRQAAAQRMTGLTGAQAPFEAPADYDLLVNTNHLDVEACVQKVVDFSVSG